MSEGVKLCHATDRCHNEDDQAERTQESSRWASGLKSQLIGPLEAPLEMCGGIRYGKHSCLV